MKQRKKIESLSKEIQDTKKSQMEILELKNTITEIEQSSGAEWRWQERGKWKTESIETEQSKEKKTKKNEQSQNTVGQQKL